MDVPDPYCLLSTYLEQYSWFIPPLRKSILDWLQSERRGQELVHQNGRVTWVDQFLATKPLWAFDTPPYRLHLLQLRLFQFFVDFEDHGLSTMQTQSEHALEQWVHDTQNDPVRGERFPSQFYGPALSRVNTWMNGLAPTPSLTTDVMAKLAMLLWLHGYVNSIVPSSAVAPVSIAHASTALVEWGQRFKVLFRARPVRFARALREVMPPPGMGSALGLLLQRTAPEAETILASLSSQILFVPRQRLTLTRTAFPLIVSFFQQDKDQTFALLLFDQFIRARFKAEREVDGKVQVDLIEGTRTLTDLPQRPEDLFWLTQLRLISSEAIDTTARGRSLLSTWERMEIRLARTMEEWLPLTTNSELVLHAADNDRWPEIQKTGLRLWWTCPLHNAMIQRKQKTHQARLQAAGLDDGRFWPMYLDPPLVSRILPPSIRPPAEDEATLQTLVPLATWKAWSIQALNIANRCLDRSILYWTMRLEYKNKQFELRTQLWTRLMTIVMGGAGDGPRLLEEMWRQRSAPPPQEQQEEEEREEHVAQAVVEEDNDEEEEKYPSLLISSSSSSERPMELFNRWKSKIATLVGLVGGSVEGSVGGFVNPPIPPNSDGNPGNGTTPPLLPLSNVYVWMKEGQQIQNAIREIRKGVLEWEALLMQWIRAMVQVAQDRHIDVASFSWFQAVTRANSAWTSEQAIERWNYLLTWDQGEKLQWVMEDVDLRPNGVALHPSQWELDHRRTEPIVPEVGGPPPVDPSVPNVYDVWTSLEFWDEKDWKALRDSIFLVYPSENAESSAARMATLPWMIKGTPTPSSIWDYDTKQAELVDASRVRAKREGGEPLDEVFSGSTSTPTLTLLPGTHTPPVSHTVLRVHEAKVTLFQPFVYLLDVLRDGSISSSLWTVFRSDFATWAELLDSLSTWPLHFKAFQSLVRQGLKPPFHSAYLFSPEWIFEDAEIMWKSRLPEELLRPGLAWALRWIVEKMEARWHISLNAVSETQRVSWTDVELYNHLSLCLYLHAVFDFLYRGQQRLVSNYETLAESWAAQALTLCVWNWLRVHNWKVVSEVLRRVHVHLSLPSRNLIELNQGWWDAALKRIDLADADLAQAFSNLHMMGDFVPPMTPLVSPPLAWSIQAIRKLFWHGLEGLDVKRLDTVWMAHAGVSENQMVLSLPVFRPVQIELQFIQMMTQMMPILQLYRALWTHRMEAHSQNKEGPQQKWSRLWAFLMSARGMRGG